MQNEQDPKNPDSDKLPVDLRPEPERLTADTVAQIKSAQTLVTVSTIAAPVSLIFGGVLLSTIALICGWVGFRKLKAVKTRNSAEAAAVTQVTKSCKMGLIMSGIAFGLNAVSFAMMYPIYMEAYETGNLAGLTGLGGNDGTSSGSAGSAGSTGNGPSSVWG